MQQNHKLNQIQIHCEFDGKSMETETTTWSEFPNGGKAIVEQILASEERNLEEQDCQNHSLRSEQESLPSEHLRQKNYKSSLGQSIPAEYVGQFLWWMLKSP